MLLILAGVTIATITGDNGILTQAQNAKKANENATIEENIKLAFQGAQIGKYTGASTEEKFKADVVKELESIYGSGNVEIGDKDNEGKYEVTILGKKYTIDANGNVTKKSGISIREQNIKLKKGEGQKLNVDFSEGLTGQIEWRSSDTDKVIVENGEITVIDEGTSPVTITAVLKSTEHTAITKVNIVQEIKSISADDIIVSKGSTAKIEVETTPSTGTVEDITYTYNSRDTSKVTVNDNTSLVTGVATTEEVIIDITGTTATKTLTTTCKVTVQKVAVTSVKIKDKNGVEQTVTKSDVGSYYGKTVNYTTGGTYRIFYIDFDGDFGDSGIIYLKADYDSNRTIECALYDTTNNPETLVKTINPDWAKTVNRGSVATTGWNNNEKAAAWLCMPTRETNKTTGLWKEYYESGKAEYVIGSPSLEMYVRSYNQVTHTTGNYELGAIYSGSNSPGYKYKYKGADETVFTEEFYTPYNGDGSLDYTAYGSMYCGSQGNKTGDWWFSSPSAQFEGFLCLVGGDGAYLGTNTYSNTFGFCPLVSLKSDFIPQMTE